MESRASLSMCACRHSSLTGTKSPPRQRAGHSLRQIFSALAAGSACLVSALTASSQQPEPTLDAQRAQELTYMLNPGPLNNVITQRFINAIRLDTEFDYRELRPQQDPVLKRNIKMNFAGSKYSSALKIDQVLITFERPPFEGENRNFDDEDGGPRPETFTLEVKFIPGMPDGEGEPGKAKGFLFLQHSEPTKADTADGIKWTYRGRGAGFLFEAREYGSLLVYIPKVKSGLPMQGVLICPRDLPYKENQTSDFSFVWHKYKPTSAVFSEVALEANTELLTGLDPGVAQLSLLTSSGLPRSARNHDAVFKRDGSARMIYTPVDGTGFPTKADDEGNIRGAIEVREMLQLPNGMTRRTVDRAGIWIERVSLSEWPPFRVTAPRVLASPLVAFVPEKTRKMFQPKKGKEWEFNPNQVGFDLKLGAGPCWVVVRLVERVSETLTKEDLHIPTRFQ